MAVLLITYDLKAPGQKHAKLLEYIRQFASAPLSESSYAIETTLSPAQVHQAIAQYTDSNDHFYVMTLKRPYSGFGRTDVNQWLDARVPY